MSPHCIALAAPVPVATGNGNGSGTVTVAGTHYTTAVSGVSAGELIREGLEVAFKAFYVTNTY
jgi:hypothetical protein